MNRMTLALVLTFALAPAVYAADLPTTEEVLERFVAAVGGRSVLEQLDVRQCRGTIVQDLTWTDPQHQETPFVAEADAAGRVRYAESADWSDLPASDSGEPRCRCGRIASTSHRNAPPSKKPTVAGTQAIPPAASAISIAGASRDQ